MDLSAVQSITDPQSLAQEVQSSLDSIAGKHIDLTSMQLLADAISGMDIVFMAVNIIVILIIIFLTGVAVRIVDGMLQNYIPRVMGKVDVKMDETVQLMIRRLVSATIYIIGLMLVILQIPQLHSLATALLAGAGIAGLAIGFAAKDSLSNFTSGVFIAVFQPFRVGDYVDFKGDYGRVEDLTLRHTVIRTWDNRRIIVPNSVMSTEPIINWSIKEPSQCAERPGDQGPADGLQALGARPQALFSRERQRRGFRHGLRYQRVGQKRVRERGHRSGLRELEGAYEPFQGLCSLISSHR
jgi:small-conductance mechanosensitive channel